MNPFSLILSTSPNLLEDSSAADDVLSLDTVLSNVVEPLDDDAGKDSQAAWLIGDILAIALSRVPFNSCTYNKSIDSCSKWTTCFLFVLESTDSQ